MSIVMRISVIAALAAVANGQYTSEDGDGFFTLLGQTCLDAQGRQMRGRWDNGFAGTREDCRDLCGNSGFYGQSRCTAYDYGGSTVPSSRACAIYGPGMDEPNANGVSFRGDSPSPPSTWGGPVPASAADPSCDDVSAGCRVCWMATPLGDGQPAIIPGCMDADASNYNPEATSDDGSCISGPDYPAGTDDADGFFTLLGQTCLDAQGRQMRGRWDNGFAGTREDCRDLCGNSGFYGQSRCTAYDYGGSTVPSSRACAIYGPGMDEPNANGVSFRGDSPSPPSTWGGPVPASAADPSCDDVSAGCRVCWMATPPGTDCAGSFSECTETCEAAADRTWTETAAQDGYGAACPTADCANGEGACVSVDCAGSFSDCTDVCEAAADRTWTETAAQDGIGATCPTVTDCANDDGSCVAGCTNPTAQNYVPGVDIDDGSCICDPTAAFRGPGAYTAGSNTAACPACNGDMDGDMVVGTRDLLLLLSDFDLTDCRLISDANGDCVVNTPDLLALLAAFGTDCMG